jgi:hypothetical protein
VEEVRKLEVDHESFKEVREVIDKQDTFLRENLEKNEKGTTHDNQATFGDGNRGLQHCASPTAAAHEAEADTPATSTPSQLQS